LIPMRRKLSLLLASLVVGALALLIASPVHAQAQGDTAISIDIPDIVILHYFNTVDVQLDAATMGDFLNGGGTLFDHGATGGFAAEVLGQFELDLGIAPNPLIGDPTNAVLLLQNAWAVRSISGGATSQTQVVISVPPASSTLTGGAGSTIEMIDAGVDIGGGAAASVSFAPTLAPPVTGDVVLTLDFGNTTAAGSHAGGVYSLTASNI
jgi:hypothetical protein